MHFINKHFNINYLGLFFLYVLLLLSGCNPEYKLAKQFVHNHEGNKIIIIPTNELFKDNLTLNYNSSFHFSSGQKDSLAWVQSAYVQHVSDSIFLTRFTNRLINELDNEGFDVYVDDGTDFFSSVPDQKWIVKVAQLQLNETHSMNEYLVYEEKVSGIEEYYANLRLNMLTLNSWVECGRADSGHMQLLFLEESIMDNRTIGFDFILNRGNKGLQQNRDSMRMDDIYYMADESGRKHAELLFNHFMNEYIGDNLPTGFVNRKYYYYDRKRKYLTQGINEWTDAEKQRD